MPDLTPGRRPVDRAAGSLALRRLEVQIKALELERMRLEVRIQELEDSIQRDQDTIAGLDAQILEAQAEADSMSKKEP